MAYVTVSTWAYDETLDEAALIRSAEENLSQLKAMGARAGYLVRTGPTEGFVVVIYPDDGCWNRVRESVRRMRANTTPETGGRNIAAMDGHALVVV